jgi:spectinomycin phosphotransferase
MREKPNLQDKRITAHLQKVYGLQIAQVVFLPLGADSNSVVYRVVTTESAAYFLKLRKANFEETSVLVPQFFSDQGIRQIIAPLKAKDGQLWTHLDAYTCVLYPFIEGRDGFEILLTDKQWLDFGAALKGIHSTVLPLEIQQRIPSETYSSHWREMVRQFQSKVAHSAFEEPVAARMAAFMHAHSEAIRQVVERAEQLGRKLQSQPQELVLCHSDIHAGNLLLTSDEAVYIVDWDNPILAPKERDLMFIGGGVGMIWNSERENKLFYQGYGAVDLNWTALTYYRYERIVQDIAAFCEEILSTLEGGEDREQGFRYFASQFLPNSVIEIAYQTDQKLKGE